MWEWTAEIYSTDRVYRGGHAYNSTADYPASYRSGDGAGDTYYGLGFRSVLYIQ